MTLSVAVLFIVIKTLISVIIAGRRNVLPKHDGDLLTPAEMKNHHIELSETYSEE